MLAVKNSMNLQAAVSPASAMMTGTTLPPPPQRRAFGSGCIGDRDILSLLPGGRNRPPPNDTPGVGDDLGRQSPIQTAVHSVGLFEHGVVPCAVQHFNLNHRSQIR